MVHWSVWSFFVMLYRFTEAALETRHTSNIMLKDSLYLLTMAIAGSLSFTTGKDNPVKSSIHLDIPSIMATTREVKGLS